MLGLGLRFGDALNLSVQAIDSNNMIVRVIGKGNKERILPLPPTLLRALRAYWSSHGHPHLLFPFGPRPLKRLPRGKVAKATKVANDGEMGILGSSPS